MRKKKTVNKIEKFINLLREKGYEKIEFDNSKYSVYVKEVDSFIFEFKIMNDEVEYGESFVEFSSNIEMSNMQRLPLQIKIYSMHFSIDIDNLEKKFVSILDNFSIKEEQPVY